MKIKPITEWRQALKLASVWVCLFIAAFPDIYNTVAALGWLDELPVVAKWCIRALAAAAIAARLIKQQSLQRGTTP
jgi:hypothetical protein